MMPAHAAARLARRRRSTALYSIAAALVLVVLPNLIKLKIMAACLVDNDLYYIHELAVYART